MLNVLENDEMNGDADIELRLVMSVLDGVSGMHEIESDCSLCPLGVLVEADCSGVVCMVLFGVFGT